MTILVLGGAGYIGSHTVYKLIEAGRDVAVVDDLSTGWRAAVHPAARFYQADIRDRAALDKIFAAENVDGVIHFAAFSQVGESMRDPLKYYDNNLAGSITLLQAMLAHGVKTLVFSSTAAVYGEPPEQPILESAPTRPVNCYGETKLAMERLIDWTAQAHGLKYAALRYFNACGAHPSGLIGEAHDPETHLIPLLLQTAAGERQSVQIFGDDYPTKDGTCIRDYVHVDDLAAAHILALDYLLAGGQSDVFNLGSSTGSSVREVLETARAVTGQPIPAALAPRRPGDPAILLAASAKSRAILGWQPQYTDLAAIIATAWRWHSSHPHGFEA